MNFTTDLETTDLKVDLLHKIKVYKEPVHTLVQIVLKIYLQDKVN